MRYRCQQCNLLQWRGYFPAEMFHWRYAVFHGIAIGICRIPVFEVYQHWGYSMTSLRGGLLSLAIGIPLLLAWYGFAITLELLVVSQLRCKSCETRRLQADFSPNSSESES